MKLNIKTLNTKNIKQLLVVCGLSFHAWSFSLAPVVDTGQLLRSGKSAMSVYGQFAYQQNPKKVKEMWNWDLMARLDQGLSIRSMNIRYFMGIGRSGWQGGTFLKWIPLSDYGYQPAIGINGGIGWRLEKFWKLSSFTDAQSHFLEIYTQPLMSKEFSTIYGPITPYLSTPIVLQTWLGDKKTDCLIQIAFGIRGELSFIYFHKFEFNIEAGWGVTKRAMNYVSLGVITRL